LELITPGFVERNNEKIDESDLRFRKISSFSVHIRRKRQFVVLLCITLLMELLGDSASPFKVDIRAFGSVRDIGTFQSHLKNDPSVLEFLVIQSSVCDLGLELSQNLEMFREICCKDTFDDDFRGQHYRCISSPDPTWS